jgi:hypothetical protein
MTSITTVGTPRWYLVGVLPEDVPLAHLMTRCDDLRYRRSACGERESRSWKAVDLTTSEVTPCPACVATLPGASATADDDLGQLSFDLGI